MIAEAFLDTNIVLYAQSQDPLEKEKKTIARELMRKPLTAISVQVIGEFYVNVTKKMQPCLSHEEATLIIRRLNFLLVHPLSISTVLAALQIKARYEISYWDALILSSATELGCKTVYSEDLNSGQIYNDIRVINPFQGRNKKLF